MALAAVSGILNNERGALVNWDDVDAFCQVVEHGGFTAAARALDRPKSSLSAAVARLEEQVGARLLERTTRSLRLSDAGESLYRDMAPPIARLRELAHDVLAQGERVQGTLRVAAPYEFGAHHLAPVTSRLMAAHPELKIHLDVEHAHVALFERPYDIVFSPVAPADSPATLVTRRVYTLPRGVYAAPALLEGRDAIAAPDDLAALPMLAGQEDQRWEFQDCTSSPAAVELRNPRMRSGNAGVRLQAAIAGLGVARITATFCDAAVAKGQLVRLLPEWRCEPLRVYAVLPGRRMVPSKVRAFLDLLEAESLGAFAT